MNDPEPALKTLPSKIGMAALWLVATLAFSMFLLRIFYTTVFGAWFAGLFPRSFWESYLDWYGRADGESGQDGELVAFAVISLIIAAVLVSVAVALAARLQRSRSSRS